MFDQGMYNKLYQAANDILMRNQQQLGVEFCRGFMDSHNLRAGQQAQQNAQTFFNYVLGLCQQQNGDTTIRNQEQLFQFVGVYIQFVGQRVSAASQQTRPIGSTFGNTGFGNTGGAFGGGGFGQTTGAFGGGGFGQGPMSSYSGEEILSTTPKPQAQPAATVATASPLSFDNATSNMVMSTKMTDNPLDSVDESGAEFSVVEAPPTWESGQPKDRRIVLSAREDLKTSNRQHQIGRYNAFHQLVLDNPMDVVKDFFAIVPDELLGSNFIFKINYHHLDVINVPTQDFVDVRERCVSAIAHDPNAPLHKTVLSVLETMQRGPWKAMTSYLLERVNRALYLSARLAKDPHRFIKLGEFDDIEDLLSSTFTHAVTNEPDGRHKLERIVGTAIWNALVMNTDAMFTGSSIPTAAMQVSPAFPFSMEGVYPNKFSIPMETEALAETFISNMHTHQLNHKTYVLSKRAVTITNVLGKNVLPQLAGKPTVFTNSVASVLSTVAIPFSELNLREKQASSIGAVLPYLSSDAPSDQLESYYANPQEDTRQEINNFARKRADLFPVDHFIFAVQYGMKPEEFLTSLDVFTTIDSLGKSQAMLAKKDVSTLHVNV
jgi:hypothetical protein